MTGYITIKNGYVGKRYPDGETEVSSVVEGRHAPLPLEPSLALRNHSPTGFEWGYNGSGPAQLALAILLDYTNDAEYAQRHYQEFKDEIIGRIRIDEWTIIHQQMMEWVDRHQILS